MDFSKASARGGLLASAMALALFGAATSAWARPAEVATPHNWKPGDGTAVAEIFESLRAVSKRAHPTGVLPVTTSVTSCADDGSAGTLRSVVTGANDGDTVDLRGLACGAIALTQGAIPIYAYTLTLIGDGADQTVIDGNAADRVLVQYGYYDLYLRGLTVRNGRVAVAGYNVAGGACILSNAYVTLDHATVKDCTAIGEGAYGAGILAPGLTMYTSTLSGNAASGSVLSTLTASYGGGAFAYRGTAALYDSTVSGNRAVGDPANAFGTYDTGAGLFTDNGGYLGRTTISGNYTDGTGGGLSTHGSFVIADSTISGNTAKSKSGGGIFTQLGGFLTIASSTIADNTSTRGGGIYVLGTSTGSPELQSTIVASNRATAGGADISSQVSIAITGANNLVVSASNVTLPADTLHTDPHLLPLASNGGPTQTQALAAGSAALDRGNNAFNLATDQRGQPRVAGAAPDIGAFESPAVVSSGTVAAPALSRWASVALMISLAFAGLRRRRR